MKVCAVVPVFEHVDTVGRVLDALRANGLPCLVVDDGNAADAAAALGEIARARPGVQLLRRPVNGGKGAAIQDGLAEAWRCGFTHALQIDADGQHDTGDIPRFLDLARAHPDRLVYGVPRYDDSVPRSRLYGRYATHVWVWINTLSLEIRDTMCGFRVYPLRQTMALLARRALPPRMDFDTEVMVRLHWRGLRFVAAPTRVTYPPGGRSHFRLLRDNLRISWMHARLFGGLLLRLPLLLWRRLRGRGADDAGRARHWAAIDEGTWLGGILFLLFVHRWFGRWPFRAAVFPVVLANWLLRPALRRASLDYLRRVDAVRGETRAPGAGRSLRHVMRFADTVLDKLLATAGRYAADVRTEGREEFYREVEAGPGAVIVTAHVGCLELCQQVARQRGALRLNILVHTAHAAKFNRLLRRLDPRAAVRLIEVSSFGPDTAVRLAERVAAGECVVIAGDRVPLGHGATASVPFLGSDARFPVGPYVLASVLQCPVFALFCIREGGGYVIHFDRLAGRLTLPRAGRAAQLQQHAGAYALRLTAMLVRSPLDWFNFFDFWKQGDGRPSGT